VIIEKDCPQGCIMSLTHGSRPGQDFSGQENDPISMPAPQVGTLVQYAQPVPYAEAWTIQKQMQEERIAERHRDALLLLEHSPIYTMGRTTRPVDWGCGEEILRRTGASLQSVDRGGSITYHGPGQVVGYPILKLSHYCSGPKQYVRKLEEVLICTLMRWGIVGYRLERKPGVWVRWDHTDAKIAAIGVRIDHGVTIHGFALNVDLDLSPFSLIMPCGLAQCQVTSMSEVRQSTVSSLIVGQQVAQEFARIFNIQWTRLDVVEHEHHGRHLPSTPPLYT
jgi:lipoyl(octanoyl) transferase